MNGKFAAAVIALMVCGSSWSSLGDDGDADHATSSESAPAANLLNTYWKLVELNGSPAPMGSGGREVHMVLELNQSRVHGFSGCNRFTGGFTRAGDALTFSKLISTRMACPDGMELESAFFAALGNAANWSITGEHLELRSEDGAVVAAFESVHLP